MYTLKGVADIHSEATNYGLGKLSSRERNFIQSIFEYSQRPDFTGLSQKQSAWLSAIVWKLEATKGKHQWQVIAERNRSSHLRYRSAYTVACFGY